MAVAESSDFDAAFNRLKNEAQYRIATGLNRKFRTAPFTSRGFLAF